MFTRRKFIKTSAAAATGTMVTSSSLMKVIKSNLDIKNVGLQLWSIAKNFEKDFAGTLEMVSKIGYKEVELFGPYSFSTEKDKTAWNSVARMVGFSQSGYFNHTAKQFKEILDSKGLTTPAMHVKDMMKRVHFSGDGSNPQQWMELFPYITDAGSGVLDLKTILSHAQKSGVEHFIIENDVITNPKYSLEKGYNYLNSLKLTD